MPAGKPCVKGRTPRSQGDGRCIVGITGDVHGLLSVGLLNRTAHQCQDTGHTVIDAADHKICYAFPGPSPEMPCTIGEDGACVLKVVLPDWIVSRSGPTSHQMASGSLQPGV